jgi:hypothetical protein
MLTSSYRIDFGLVKMIYYLVKKDLINCIVWKKDYMV